MDYGSIYGKYISNVQELITFEDKADSTYFLYKVTGNILYLHKGYKNIYFGNLYYFEKRSSMIFLY